MYACKDADYGYISDKVALRRLGGFQNRLRMIVKEYPIVYK